MFSQSQVLFARRITVLDFIIALHPFALLGSLLELAGVATAEVVAHGGDQSNGLANLHFPAADDYEALAFLTKTSELVNFGSAVSFQGSRKFAWGG